MLADTTYICNSFMQCRNLLSYSQTV